MVAPSAGAPSDHRATPLMTTVSSYSSTSVSSGVTVSVSTAVSSADSAVSVLLSEQPIDKLKSIVVRFILFLHD